MSRIHFLTKFGILTVTLAVIFTSMVINASAQLTGAIYTTDLGCTGVNVNLFPSKADVYLDGGPPGNGSGLPDGNYYVKVTAPNGFLLGMSPTANVTVVLGKFVECYQLSAILEKASNGDPGYDTTTNNGGEYKVWVSPNPSFPNNRSKTDNFKVRNTPPPPKTYNLSGCKFYDANANGIWDPGEVKIPGFKILISLDGAAPIEVFTAANGCWSQTDVAQDTAYLIAEELPIGSWEQSFPADSPNGRVHEGFADVPACQGSVCNIDGLDFGNFCTSMGTGRTHGFWGNKNGQTLFGTNTTSNINGLIAFNLRNAAGAHFNPASYAAFKTWNGSANATNMAYMLSVQMASTWLNVNNGIANGSQIVIVNGQVGTINGWIGEANTSLGSFGDTTSPHAERSNQERLKNIFDAINNSNFVYVNTGPCSVEYP